MQDPHLSPQTFSQARHPTKTREINGTETPHTLHRAAMTALFMGVGALLGGATGAVVALIVAAVMNGMRRLRPIDFARFRWVMRLREGLL